MSGLTAPRARLAHAGPERLRVRLHAPRGQGHLHRLAAELERMPHTRTVRANHAARSVAVTFDPAQVSVPVLIERLCTLGLIVLDFNDPLEWGGLVAAEWAPRAEDSTTWPGRLNQELQAASAGRLDLFRVLAGLVMLIAGVEVRAALLRGDSIPWLRLLAYLLTAVSLWSRSPAPGTEGSRTRARG